MAIIRPDHRACGASATFKPAAPPARAPAYESQPGPVPSIVHCATPGCSSPWRSDSYGRGLVHQPKPVCRAGSSSRSRRAGRGRQVSSVAAAAERRPPHPLPTKKTPTLQSSAVNKKKKRNSCVFCVLLLRHVHMRQLIRVVADGSATHWAYP